MSFRKKPLCINCHFFCRGGESIRDDNFLIEEKGRRALKEKNYEDDIREVHRHLACYFKVWDERVDNKLKNERITIVSEIDRKDRCFYKEYTPGMAFDAAEILQRREADYKEAERDRKITRRALWTAIIALIINTIISILNIIITFYHSPNS